MKKIINMILVTALSLSLIGCKESVVLEEKVKSIDGVKSFNVVETPVEIKGQLIYPSLFINGNVYGAEAIRSDSDYSSIIGLKGYYIDKDGNYNVDNESKIFLTEFGNVSSMSYCGLTKEYDNRDILLGDNKYFVLTLNLYNDNLSSSNLIEQTLFIIEMESGKTIKVKTKNKDESSSILYMYYYENINSIMAIMSDNKVKKITITDNDIKLENYKELNFQDYELYTDFGNYIKSYKDSLIFFLKYKDNFSEENFIENTRFGVYNKITGEVQLLDKDIFIMEVFGKSNLISVIYNDDSYLAEIDEDNNIELIYKFDKGEHDYIFINGISNGEGNRLFIRKTLFNEGPESNTKEEYSFIDLK